MSMQTISQDDDIYVDQRQIAFDTLERYCGTNNSLFQPYVLLTNFPKYVDYFGKRYDVPISEGSMFKVAHSEKLKISILDFKIGSPAAALTIDLCSFLPISATLFLGMCGGLRDGYQRGDYFVPIGSIRGEATSDFYFPPEVPALANFFIQKEISSILDSKKIPYHIGITHTTNKRFWEFNLEFRRKLQQSRAQAIEMECATLFTSSYSYHVPLGALLLISDLPMYSGATKTKADSDFIYENLMGHHVDLGVEALQAMQNIERIQIDRTAIR